MATLARLKLKKALLPQSTFRGRYHEWKMNRNKMLENTAKAMNHDSAAKEYAMKKKYHEEKIKYLKSKADIEIRRKRFRDAGKLLEAKKSLGGTPRVNETRRTFERNPQANEKPKINVVPEKRFKVYTGEKKPETKGNPKKIGWIEKKGAGE